jgi:hypothetical protein
VWWVLYKLCIQSLESKQALVSLQCQSVWKGCWLFQLRGRVRFFSASRLHRTRFLAGGWCVATTSRRVTPFRTVYHAQSQRQRVRPPAHGDYQGCARRTVRVYTSHRRGGQVLCWQWQQLNQRVCSYVDNNYWRVWLYLTVVRMFVAHSSLCLSLRPRGLFSSQKIL